MTTIECYDETALVRDVTRVGIRSRVAFAAACAERLFPAYEDFCKRFGRDGRAVLAAILERVWQHLLGEEMNTREMHSELSRCMALIPVDDDEATVDEQPYADDAVSAVAYTLRTLESSEPQEAVWAARRAYEAADHHVMHRLGVENESQVLAHPIVRAELSRQQRDLQELVGAERESAALFTRLRDRARAEASTFFAPAPSYTPTA